MTLRFKLFLVGLFALITLAHVGLWRDPDIAFETKRRLTTLNALGWGVIILPVFLVNQWLKAKTAPEDHSDRADKNNAPERKPSERSDLRSQSR